MYCTPVSISLVSCSPGFLCFLSITPAYVVQEEAILGAVRWISFSCFVLGFSFPFFFFFFKFSFNSFRGEEYPVAKCCLFLHKPNSFCLNKWKPLCFCLLYSLAHIGCFHHRATLTHVHKVTTEYIFRYRSKTTCVRFYLIDIRNSKMIDQTRRCTYAEKMCVTTSE